MTVNKYSISCINSIQRKEEMGVEDIIEYDSKKQKFWKATKSTGQELAKKVCGNSTPG